MSRIAPLHQSEHAPRWFGWKSLGGHIAMWACRQSPYTVPDDLGIVIEETRRLFLGEAEVDFPHLDGYVNWTPSRLERFLEDTLWSIEAFRKWNVAKAYAERPDEQPPFVVTSRFGGPAPDYDIIDPHALYRNVVSSLFAELDADVAWDEEHTRYARSIRGRLHIWRLNWRQWRHPASESIEAGA